LSCPGLSSRFVLLVLLGFALAGCARKPVPFEMPEKAELAVSPFTQPDQRHEMLSGYVQETQHRADPKVLQALDRILRQELASRKDQAYRSGAQVEQCREIVLYENEPAELDGLTYWSLVGRCLPTEYLLVPQLISWRARQGGKWGADVAARVEFYLFLLNVQKERVASVFHFNQEQAALSENVFTFPRFVERGGQWITAEQLAREGIIQGLEELGL